MSYKDHFAEHLRIALLRALLDCPECKANDSILRDLVATVGLSATRDQVRGVIAWLSEQGLTRHTDLGGLYVATLTERGEDVAMGRATAPGVRRPTPRG
ncbi:VpaChn25_0724 family phage protein [Brevundimonas sp.]|uniref:VpaChn25_0724 family phage protein n=1 Tax=Brevundimonas sp. TaxID=1871086 RepID=UPI003D6C748C